MCYIEKKEDFSGHFVKCAGAFYSVITKIFERDRSGLGFLLMMHSVVEGK